MAAMTATTSSSLGGGANAMSAGLAVTTSAGGAHTSSRGPSAAEIERFNKTSNAAVKQSAKMFRPVMDELDRFTMRLEKTQKAEKKAAAAAAAAVEAAKAAEAGTVAAGKDLPPFFVKSSAGWSSIGFPDSSLPETDETGDGDTISSTRFFMLGWGCIPASISVTS